MNSRSSPATDGVKSHRIICHLDALLKERGMTLTELAKRTGVSIVNLSVLKTNQRRSIRFSTLTAICDVLNVTPGDLLAIDDAPSSSS